MPTFTLNGFTILDDTRAYVGPTSFTLTLPQDYVVRYEYSDTGNNPGFASIDIADRGIFIPEAFFDLQVNTPSNAAPYGNADNDEVYFVSLSLNTGTTLTVLIVHEALGGRNHIFVLDSTGAFSVPQNQTEVVGLLAQVTDVGPVTSGPFAPAVDIDFALVTAATLAATSDDDSWTGTIADEVFDGGPGNDTLDGEGGQDTINGGADNDLINGGSGVDLLNGGDGDDTIDGGADADTISGGLGDDSLTGGGGLDRLNYGDSSGPVRVDLVTGIVTGASGTDTVSGFEEIIGSDFDDTIIGGNTFQLWLNGGAGNDSLVGGSGEHSAYYATAPDAVSVNLGTGIALDGTGGVDTLVNLDVVIASAFDDTLIGSDNDELFLGLLGNDSIDGGAGFDEVSYFWADSGVVVNLATGRSSGGHGVDTLTSIEGLYGSDHDDRLTGDALNNRIGGNSGDDTMDGGDGNDTMRGDTGDDSMLGGGGDDLIEGGRGADTLIGNSGNDRLFGNSGDDLLVGGFGADFLRGDADNDTLYGFSGNDTLRGDVGLDQLFGGVGNDQLYGGDDNDTLSGGDGNDRLFGEQGNDRLFGENGNDAIFGGFGDDALFGFNGNDFLDGFFGNDTLYGEQGNDVINGGDGNDRVFAGVGDDQVFGGNGNDVSFGWIGNDRMFGQQGNDTIFGEGGNDLIDGGAGDDVLNGGVGHDRLFGWGGNDLMTGGADADVFIFANGGGRDTITDFQTGVLGEVIDLSFVSAITNMAQLNAAAMDTTNGVLITLAPNNTILLQGLTESQLSADDFIFT